jgi:hypothetical protein
VFVVIYAVCLFYGSLIPAPELQQLHELTFRLWFPGFAGYDALSMMWGGSFKLCLRIRGFGNFPSFA